MNIKKSTFSFHTPTTRIKRVKCTPCETREFSSTPTKMLLPAYVVVFFASVGGNIDLNSFAFSLGKYTCETN